MTQNISNENQKATESINIRLNKEESDLLDKYAADQSGSSAVNKILSDNGCFDYDDISDDVYNSYLNLLKSPEFNFVNSQRIPKNEIRIVRCWLTKNQKKSLFYLALEKHKTSPSVFVKDILRKTLFGSDLSQNSDDILVKKIWANVSAETKKELFEGYLKSQNETNG